MNNIKQIIQGSPASVENTGTKKIPVAKITGIPKFKFQTQYTGYSKLEVNTKVCMFQHKNNV